MTVAYDAGALIAAERSDRALWADHRVRLELGLVPMTTAPVVAQVSRSPRQVQLRRFLRGCIVTPFATDEAEAVGALMATARTSDVVDAHLVLVSAERIDSILTSDVGDIELLVGAASSESPPVVRRV